MDSLLKLLLQASALSGVAHAGKHLNSAPRRGKIASGRRRQTGGSNGMYPVNSQDLAVNPPDIFAVPKSVPLNIASMIVWDTVKFDTPIALSTTSNVETNFSFQLAQHPQSGSWTALFDQWTIPQASVTFRARTPPGATVESTLFYTALDFDNTAAIGGSIANIEDFSTCDVHTLSEGAVFTRTIRPCCKGTVSTSNTGSNLSSGVERLWLDCGITTSTNFYGIRTIAAQAGSNTYVIATVTVWYAFRNQV
jgi:hypothetical protein